MGMGVRAVVVDPDAAGGFRFDEIPEPRPAADHIVLDVHHVSVNHGDVRPGAWPAGTVPGFDAAGVVTRTARDGTGPAVGTRVAVFAAGAWARRMVAGVGDLAEIPAGVDTATAAALPVAGVTALRVLRAGGDLAGRRVLVTGAAGGVGRLAVQLAARAGAHVTASVGAKERGAGLAALGADAVVVGLDGVAEGLDVVVDTVGGPQLVAAWGLLGPGGEVRSVGWASGEAAVFPPYSTFAMGEPRRMVSFGDAAPAGADLAELLALVADEALVVDVALRLPWDRAVEAAAALRDRRVAGKVVLDVRAADGADG